MSNQLEKAYESLRSHFQHTRPWPHDDRLDSEFVDDMINELTNVELIQSLCWYGDSDESTN